MKSPIYWKNLSLFICVFGLALLTSCEDDPEFFEPNSFETFGIRHDRDLNQYEAIAANSAPFNTSDFPDFSPVVAFTYSLDGSDNFEYVASGVLIHPEWILTAGHNFFVSDAQSTPAKVEGIIMVTGNDPNLTSNTHEVEQLVFHPTWLEDDDIYANANDLCLVKLKNPILSITPALILEEELETIGSTTWQCGFGDYSRLAGQDPDLYSLKHATKNTLDRIVDNISSSSSAGNYTGGLVAVDFDDPDGMINSLGDDFENEDELLLKGGQSSSVALDYEGSAVEGDSGGPLFIRVNGQWMVTGILSGSATDPVPNHSDGNYGEIDIYTRVSTAFDWIKTVVK